MVFVDLYIEADFVDETPEGIVQWAVSVQVDPTVLEPIEIQGAQPGYFLYDFAVLHGRYVALLPPSIDKGAGIMQWISEGIIGDPPMPVGAGTPGWPCKLVTLIFESLSETAHSPIDLYYEPEVDAWYWQAWDTTRNFPIPVDEVVDGHYNMPPDARTMDALGTVIPPAPIGSDWHEIEPDFCTDWSLESWEDNGDGILSASDQVDMQRPSDPAPIWFHVEWVAPLIIANDDHPDMMVTEKPPVPEFPLGSVAPIALIVAVAYLWLMKKRERPKVMCPCKER